MSSRARYGGLASTTRDPAKGLDTTDLVSLLRAIRGCAIAIELVCHDPDVVVRTQRIKTLSDHLVVRLESERRETKP
jgi:hypothetical protein